MVASPRQRNGATLRESDATVDATMTQPVSLKDLADAALKRLHPQRKAQQDSHSGLRTTATPIQKKRGPRNNFATPGVVGMVEYENPIHLLRDWWWNEFDSGADSAEFDAGTTESAQELLPTLRGLVWPDFGVRAEGTLLCLNRACVRHYPHDENPDMEDQDA